MKTALLLSNSAETQRLLTEILGEKTNIVLLPAPSEPSRVGFDDLFKKWLHLVDAVILDAASLDQSTRWAVESLHDVRLQEHQAIVVRATATQRTLYPMSESWLVVLDTDDTEQLKRSLRPFFELRDAQAKLKRADAVIARQRHPTGLASAAVSLPQSAAPVPAFRSAVVSFFDAYRYRDALKDLSRILSQHLDENGLLSEFLSLARELLGVGKAAIFARRLRIDLFSNQLIASSTEFTVARSTGLPQPVVEHLRLSVDSGIGGYLAHEARILRRAQVLDTLALDYDPEIAREFELLGTDVVVPMFDDDQLLGLLTFGGRITGEPLANEELELIHHLLTQLAQAIRNFHLRDRMAGQQRFLSETLAHIHSGVVAIGQDCRILTMNHQACALLGLEAESVIGQDIGRLPARVSDLLFEAMQVGKEIRNREVVLPRSNRSLSISATRFAASLAGMQGTDSHLVTVALIEDLTQAKLQQAHERELADKEFFTRLAARLSHELKNSLVSIKIFAQLLPERYNEKEFREQFSGVVVNEVNRVDVLVNNLTFFSHPLDLVHEEVVLSELIENCLANVAQECGRKKLMQVVALGEKTAETAPAIPTVMVKKTFGHKLARLEGDRIRLVQSFEHVIRNALQAMPTGGRLSVSTADAQPGDFPGGELPPGGAVRIEWQDTGEGIALENLTHVAEPFVTTRNVGVGLGLTIVKKIIERHGGRLEIDSMLGRGTTVGMILPFKAQPHPEDALLQQLANEPAASEPGAESYETARRLPQVSPHDRGENS